jgi:tRNA threonylcarbamoyl adenosine modification protein YeaZ
MILAFDTSSAACTAALFQADGTLAARADERIERGHAERLVPMLDELLAGRRATGILVGVGPGSFTGIRVGIAAAHGLAIGWDCELYGFSSLALLAASAEGEGDVAAAVVGGHGQLFVQSFYWPSLEPIGTVQSLTPEDAAHATTAPLVVGSGAEQLVGARGYGEAREAWPSAANVLSLPESLRTLPARPVYARPPDAKTREAA